MKKLAILLVFVSALAQAQAENIISKLSRVSLKEILSAEGYSAEYDDTRGDWVQWKIEGFKCFVIVSPGGTALQFFAVFKATDNTSLGKVNGWNRSKRFSRTYLDTDGDPCLELDLDLKGGVTRERITDFLKTAKLSFETWRKEVLN